MKAREKGKGVLLDLNLSYGLHLYRKVSDLLVFTLSGPTLYHMSLHFIPLVIHPVIHLPTLTDYTLHQV